MLRRSAAVFLGVIACHSAFAQGIITTIAGTDWLFPGNNKPARNAPLGRVAGATFDRAGNLLIADPDNGQVFKVDTIGGLTVFAGNGFRGYSGDGGPATAASLDSPNSLAVDQAGNVYIADIDNRIRKVAPSGIISTIAGNGAYDDTGDGGLAVQASFKNPAAVAVDRNGDVYVADVGGGRIRKIGSDGRINAVAGTTRLNAPTDIVFDAAGNLYIGESGTLLIRRLDVSGNLKTIAGTGEYLPPVSGVPAISAPLRGPFRLALDVNGALYISDENHGIVQMVDTTGIITTVAGTGDQAFSGDGGPALKAVLNTPRGIAVDAAGNLLLCDSLNQRVRRVTTAGTIDTFAGNNNYRFGGDGGPAIAALFNQPNDIKFDSAGNLYVVDSLGNRVRKISPKGIITTFAGTGERGYSGDGGPAANARLYDPTAVAIDATGNVYITDSGNHVIRRVRADGTISTFAGTGTSGYNGEGIPATQARINYPAGIAFDSKGNLFFADDGGFRVRKIDSGGLMTTVAGTGEPAENGAPIGDGGPATKAVLGYLDGLAVDAAGNLYVSEKYVGRVRKVDSSGKISTYAGLLDAPTTGDGGPATKAGLGPRGLTVDAAGNLFIADQGLSRIRKVAAATGIITTVAGSDGGFGGDGGSAVLARLANPVGVALDGAGDIYIADTGNYRIRSVTSVQPPFTVSTDSLTFAAQSGGAPTIEQQLIVSSTITNTAFTATASDNWLTVTPAAGLMPGIIQASADPGSLSVGDYEATITITAPTATPSTRVVTVRFHVTAAADPKLTAEPERLDFTRVQGSTAETQSFRVLNNGSGTLDFTVTFTPTSGGNWLQVSPASGTVSATAPVRLSATGDPAGLAAGTYAGLLTIAAAKVNQRVLVPVAMTVNSSAQNIVLSQTGLTFTVVSGAASPPGQQVGVLNTGLGNMNWNAAVSTTSDGNWLSIAPAGGTSGPAGTNIGYVQVNVNPAGLTTGEYYGRATVSSPDAPNSPQTISVVLRILPPGTTTPPDVRPTGFIFVATAGGAPPPTQTAVITNLGTTPLTYVSSTVINSAGGGSSKAPFSYRPVSGTVNPGDPVAVVIQAQAADATPGIQRGTITFQFSDGSIRPVDVLVAVPAAASNESTVWGGESSPQPPFFGRLAPSGVQASGAGKIAGARPGLAAVQAATCTARSLSLVFTLLGQQFLVPASWPSPVEVRVVDDCGVFLNSGSVVLTFSNFDTPVTMVPIGDGRWSGTWQPRGAAQTVRITATAQTSDRTAQGSVQITGGISSNAAVPVIPPGSVVNAASFAAGAPIAPGSLISIFGSRLSDSPNATVPPLPIKLGNTLVDLGGIALPLYYVSDQQINAIVPYSLPVNTRLELVVQRGTQLTVPQFVTVAPAQPAVFTADGTGTGQGDIFDVNGVLVDRGHPARAGDTVVIYCAGLGAVDQPVSVTQAAPTTPLSNAVAPVTVTIGGQKAFTAFAGLTPGYTGLYQVNAVIPGGVAAGDAVAVTISLAGQVSPPVTMSVR
jgi:uncharacterized protein (TIGR03437 family)